MLSTAAASASSDDALRAMMDNTMSLESMLGQLDRQIGFTTAIANMKEALGQTAKGRGEAAKQLV